MSEIFIKKEDGKLELFDSQKLRQSLLRSNASIILANDIVKKIEENLKPETSTSEIYRTAFGILKETEKNSAIRYSIRRSILNLGPTGFPFEKYIDKILQKKGYQTAVGVTLQGQCIEHEIDIAALSSKGELFLSEIKFHNELSLKSDVKVALYIKARFDDLKEIEVSIFNQKLKPKRMIIINNTKFTDTAIKYAKCVGLDLISWDYPANGNLHTLAYETDTYPITILDSLDNSEKNKLIADGVVTCDDLIYSDRIKNFPQEKVAEIMDEIEIVNAK